MLLTFIVGDQDGKIDFQSTTEDLLIIDFKCINYAVKALASSKQGRESLVKSEVIPAIGHVISILLEAMGGAKSLLLGLSSLRAIQAFVESLDRKILASFLPGILSSLTKVIMPSASNRRPHQVLEEALDVTSDLLKSTLRNDFRFDANDAKASTDKFSLVTASQSWLKATVGQIKVALTNIVKIYKHDRLEVQTALQRLCEVVLQECNQNLENVIALTLDTLIALTGNSIAEKSESTLRAVLSANAEYVEYVKQSLYDKFISLPRVIISNDPTAKESLSIQIKASLRLLVESDVGLWGEGEFLLSAIREGLASTMQRQSEVVKLAPSVMSTALSNEVEKSEESVENQFPSLLIVDKGNYENMMLISSVIDTISTTEESLNLVRSCLDNVSQLSTEGAVSDLWISLHILRNRASSESEIDDLLNLDLITPQEHRLREEVYKVCSSILTRSEDETANPNLDWRLQALSLEAMAFHAFILKKSFLPELSDILYPILHFLGSEISQLRSHAIITLNSVASSVGYSSPQELIIANNDYLINGISLKLSIFELSPQAPQVLNMLVRLCGSRLLPYLDDLTDNIFEALECFHGYAGLVALLFQCLGAIVEEGVKAPALTVEHIARPSHRLEPETTPSLADTVRALKGQIQAGTNELEEADEEILNLPQETPRQSWKDLDQMNRDPPEEDTNAQNSTDEETPPPLSSSYKLIQRITILTQHHLPSANPLIRSHLSHVLSTAMPYLSNHEDTFLPLVHTLWPVLVPRLHDNEVSVVTGVLDVMGQMAEGAGSFMRGRVADIWADIRLVHQRASAGLSGPSNLKGTPRLLKAMHSTIESPNQLMKAGELKNITSTAQDSGPSNYSKNPSKSENSLDLVPATTRSLQPRFTPSKQESFGFALSEEYGTSSLYSSTTTITLRRALTSFLLSLVRHVHVPAWVFDEISSELLLPYLVLSPNEASWIDESTRKEVKRTLTERNEDAIWLILLRHGKLSDCESQMKQSVPLNVNGAPDFMPFVKGF